MNNKLQSLILEYEMLIKKMSKPDIVNDISQYTKLAKEHRRLTPLIQKSEAYLKLESQIKEGEEIFDTSGILVTGEEFEGISELKKIIAGPRKKDFHRCLTEKLFTYALGRGVEYYDSPVINKIIKDAENKGGGLKEFIYALIESVPFQMRRAEQAN